VEEVSAVNDDSLGFAHPLMSKFAMPTKRIPCNEFTRINGNQMLTMTSPSIIGLPYGGLARIILCRLTTLAKISKSREVYLGDSMNQFVVSLDKTSSGGKTGTLSSLKEQCKRLIACSIKITEETKSSWSLEGASISENAFISSTIGGGAWQPVLKLTQQFYDEVHAKAFPIDMRVMHACSHYPMAIDIYCWLTHRAFTLNSRVFISWGDLINQLGNSYSRESNFKNKFKKAIERVKLFYSASNFIITKSGVLLLPFKPHVPKLTLVKSPARVNR
jgi:hypothetical protein